MSRAVVMYEVIGLFCPVKSIELLLQIIVKESRSALTSGLEEETAAWVRNNVYTHRDTERHE